LEHRAGAFCELAARRRQNSLARRLRCGEKHRCPSVFKKISNFKFQIANRESQTTNDRWQMADGRWQIVNRESQIRNWKFQITNWKSQISNETVVKP
jgi:hypothetical protein